MHPTSLEQLYLCVSEPDGCYGYRMMVEPPNEDIEAANAPVECEGYLSPAEEAQICERFEHLRFEPGGQVMWTGVPREWVQKWADERGLQTLSTVMGPLMDKKNPACLKSEKSAAQWKRYIKGASKLFALYVPKNHKITVLTRPLPERFSLEGHSTFQMLEEPILKGANGGDAVSRIDLVHLTVENAQEFRYQVWPRDEIDFWHERIGP